MKNIFTIACLLFVQIAFAQVSGSINYREPIKYSDINFDILPPSKDETSIQVKGLANVKADQYVAIFTVTQIAETTDEVNKLLDSRLNSSINRLQTNKTLEFYIDMISFVPVYQYDVQRKIFSKKTYNEVPTGFELKKNLHIKFKNPAQLNEIMSVLSQNEIYDLVRVDYFIENMDVVKKELASKAKTQLQEKIKSYESIIGISFPNANKNLNEGYKVVLPTEMYKAYEAYNGSTLALTKFANVNQANKSTSMFYQPILDKEFDFVVNPVVLEPVIQVMYEIKMTITKDKKESPNYQLITPNGEIKKLTL